MHMAQHRRRPGRALFATAALLAAGAADAGRPLQTEDAAVLDARACELESFLARQQAEGEATTRAASLQLACGVGAATQLGLQALRERAGDSHAHELALLGKTALLPLADDSAGFTLACGVRAARPGSGTFDYAGHFFTAVGTLPLGPWLVHANLGTAHERAAGIDSTTWALAVERTGLGRFDAMAELYGDDRTAPSWNLGLRYTAIEDRLFLDASYGQQLRSGRPALVTLGLKYAF